MRLLFVPLILLISLSLNAQKLYPVAPAAGESLPEWAVQLYGEKPNVWSIDAAYRRWRLENPTKKTTYTQYYKKWRRAVQGHIDANGFVDKITPETDASIRERIRQIRAAESGLVQQPWRCIGPFETFSTNEGPNPPAQSSQVNVYCLDQSLSDPNVLYCGTEGSEIFKSLDKGKNWICVSRTYAISTPTAIEVHPLNPDVVFVGEGNNIRKSTDGGNSWTSVLTVGDLGANEILVNPAQPNIVLAATYKGLYRSVDEGQNWVRLFPEACYDVEWKTDDPGTAFLLRNDPSAKICRFYKSSDSGLNWTLKSNGWFFSNEPGVNDGGARLAVTNADPNRVYAVLIGEAREGDSGFIGIWRSNDAGENWALPNPPAGGPWIEGQHPNMATIGQTGGYHQGFYNLGFDASDTNPDQLLAGFLNLWISYDGATSFTCIGGYCGNDFNYVHPDCQEIEINGSDVWMTSDGGIEYSDDFFETHYARNRGITSSDFWGFATGWNDDLFVGGRYHNGNTAWYENWTEGECLSLGGGEAPTGYVNPGPGLETYHSDLGGVILPETQNGFAEYFGFGKFPNESYYDAESGEMEFDPRCWNTIFVSHKNVLWKSEDGGASWDDLFTFGNDANANTMGFEISRSNPDVIYLFQRDAYTWDPGKLWKTNNAGLNWTELNLPPGYARRMVLTLSPENENQLWIAYPDAGDDEKVYQSNDGGQSWINLTTSALDGEHITHILHQGGTDGGIYIGTYRTVWYRDNVDTEWTPLSDGLPESIATCLLRPFYRDQKIRLGAYGKGVWEMAFVKPSRPVAQPMVNKRQTACPGDTLQFDDYSMLEHAGAEWQWQFPGGTPATSNLRNPKVVYNNQGEYDVTLTVINAQGSSTKTVQKMVRVDNPVVNSALITNDFSGGLGNFTIVNPDNGITWSPLVLNTCNPEGDTVYFVENYVYSSYGQDEILLPINMDMTQLSNPILRFRVAYAPYYDGNFFIDSLKVLISDNCGSAFKTIFRSGGEDLSTTTSGIGPNTLYEYDAFTPQNCEEWKDIELDLSAYSGKYVTIRIVNQSGYGNNMYIDDISLSGQPISSTQTPQAEFNMSLKPNPSAGDVVAQGVLSQAQTLTLTLYKTDGQLLWQQTKAFPTGPWQQLLPLQQQPAGLYWLRVSDESGNFRSEKIIRR